MRLRIRFRIRFWVRFRDRHRDPQPGFSEPGFFKIEAWSPKLAAALARPGRSLVRSRVRLMLSFSLSKYNYIQDLVHVQS